MPNETGPIYNVPLINSLPLCSAAPDGMRQAMPNRADLERVNKLSARTAAGYELLLATYLNQSRRLAAAQAELAKVQGDLSVERRGNDAMMRQLEQAQTELATAQAACAAWNNAAIGIRDKACKGAFLFGTAQDDKAIEAHLDTIDACIPMNLANPGQALLDRLAAAQAVVDKLPVYADTGKPFIPDKDGAWVIDCQWPDSPPHPAPVVRTYWNYGTAKWAFDIQTPMGSGIRMVYGPAYSCKAAALAAKEAGQ